MYVQSKWKKNSCCDWPKQRTNHYFEFGYFKSMDGQKYIKLEMKERDREGEKECVCVHESVLELLPQFINGLIKCSFAFLRDWNPSNPVQSSPHERSGRSGFTMKPRVKPDNREETEQEGTGGERQSGGEKEKLINGRQMAEACRERDNGAGREKNEAGDGEEGRRLPLLRLHLHLSFSPCSSSTFISDQAESETERTKLISIS